MVEHFFTVDVEEYFHVTAFESVVSRAAWSAMPSCVDRGVSMLLEDLAAAKAKGTFFVLGWVARHNPAVVRRIAAEGHEIASHGFWHQRVSTQARSAFQSDVRAAKIELEQLVGSAVTGYRAPSFSIIPGCEWAFDVLLEEGYAYDSSLFPIRRAGYGYPTASQTPYRIVRPAGVLSEFPLATRRIAGIQLPAAGGGYLRHFPFGVVRGAFRDASRRNLPATFYIHPWELDPEQPRVPVGLLTRIRHYRGLARTRTLIRRLLQEFRFTSLARFLASEIHESTSSAGRQSAPSPDRNR